MSERESARPTEWTGYLAAVGFEAELERELSCAGGQILEQHGRLYLAGGPPRPAHWAQNIWFDPLPIKFESVGDAARKLRGIQRSWALYSNRLHRRGELIQALLPPLRTKPYVFGEPAPRAPLGSFTLLDPHTLIASARCERPFAHGGIEFVEDKAAPPNRAYLKLWELFTLLDVRPAPGERCVDLGASPGGWTWVLASLGANVLAIDKAVLEPRIAKLPTVEFRQQSAFAVDPTQVGQIDWLFSDVICYPRRSLALVERWLAAGVARHLVCTIKFQAATDHATTAAFAAIPGARLLHLHNNKHELTWVRLGSR
ncbi:MAG: SAM-dependent methyltransferase [Planctomycetota bacterium]